MSNRDPLSHQNSITMQSVIKEYVLPLLNSATDAEVIPGDMVRLHLTDSIPGLPTPILAVVQHPIDRIMVINPATNCRVNGYRYTFLYDEAQLEGVVEAITECDIISVETTSCCELLSEQIAAETAARIAADDAIVAGVGAVKYSEDQGLNQAQRSVALQNILPLVDGPPYMATLAPAGANNDIAISTDLPFTHAEIVIDNTTDRTGLTVASLGVPIGGSTLSTTSGDKRNMRVTTDFGDGVETVDLVYDGEAFGRPAYLLQVDLDSFYSLGSTGVEWILAKQSDGVFIGDRVAPDTAFPDLADWSGLATVVAHPATAAQVIEALNAFGPPTPIATDAPGSDGSGFVAAESVVFTPTPETALPPSGTFTSNDGQLITVTNGIITSMVLP